MGVLTNFETINQMFVLIPFFIIQTSCSNNDLDLKNMFNNSAKKINKSKRNEYNNQSDKPKRKIKDTEEKIDEILMEANNIEHLKANQIKKEFIKINNEQIKNLNKNSNKESENHFNKFLKKMEEKNRELNEQLKNYEDQEKEGFLLKGKSDLHKKVKRKKDNKHFSSNNNFQKNEINTNNKFLNDFNTKKKEEYLNRKRREEITNIIYYKNKLIETEKARLEKGISILEENMNLEIKKINESQNVSEYEKLDLVVEKKDNFLNRKIELYQIQKEEESRINFNTCVIILYCQIRNFEDAMKLKKKLLFDMRFKKSKNYNEELKVYRKRFYTLVGDVQ